MINRCVSILLSLILLLYVLLRADDSTGTLIVRVSDAEIDKIEPLPAVSLTIDEIGIEAMTNIEGYCTLTAIPEGTYTLDCRMIGYCNETVRGIKVIKECTTTVNVQLWWSIHPAIPIYTDTIDFGPKSLVDTTKCPIEAKVFVEKDTFCLGEEVVLWCEIKNTAKFPIFIVEPLVRWGYLENELTRSILIIEDSEGKVIKRHVLGVGGPSIYGKDIKFLYPNETYELLCERVILNKLYAIEEPGKYCISMHIKQNRKFLYKRIRQQAGIYFPNCDFYTDRLEITILPERK